MADGTLEVVREPRFGRTWAHCLSDMEWAGHVGRRGGSFTRTATSERIVYVCQRYTLHSTTPYRLWLAASRTISSMGAGGIPYSLKQQAVEQFSWQASSSGKSLLSSVIVLGKISAIELHRPKTPQVVVGGVKRISLT